MIPGPLEGIATGDEFLKRLPEFDETFDKMRREAAAEGKVLRFVGVVDAEEGVVKAGLEKYVVWDPPAVSWGRLTERYLCYKVPDHTPLCDISGRFR